MILAFVVGLLLSGLVGLIGFWQGSLSKSGVFGAVVVGTPIFGFGGIVWGAVLVAFFASSSALSHYGARLKFALADKFQKGSRRDLTQALANGGLAALISVMFGAWHAEALFVAFLGALAAVTADTWATEIGVLSTVPPRLITTWKTVPVGTSGGITLLGTVTALFGAAFIGICGAAFAAVLSKTPQLQASILFYSHSELAALVIAAAGGGLLGCLFDSLLGATVQAIYYCDHENKETERRVHSCGRETRRLRGLPWMDNDAVNFLASVFGSAASLVIWAFVRSMLQAT